MFTTTDVSLQKALEARSDFGGNGRFFLQDDVDRNERPKVVAPEDFKVFPEVKTINMVKNIMRSQFEGLVKGSDLATPKDMYLFCNKHGLAFPNFFTKEQGHFLKQEEQEKLDKQVLEEEVDETPEKVNDTQEFEEIEVDPKALAEMKRADLDAKAEEFGVENPQDLPNKKAVIDAILNL